MEKTEGVLELELVSLVAGAVLVGPSGGSGNTGDGTDAQDTGGEGETPDERTSELDPSSDI